MLAFAAGQINVLVTTTVIEVGVDVPNATTMVVMDADRFGVSQLHQLRGRVGRGGHHGLCLLVTAAEAQSPARERLDAVAATSAGSRYPGSTSSGAGRGRARLARPAKSSLKLLTLLKDEELIGTARKEATDLVEADPVLATQPALAEAIAAMLNVEQAEFLEKA